MRDNTEEMNRVLKLLSRAEDILQSGASMEDVYQRLKVSEQEFTAYLDQYSAPPNGPESLTNASVSQAVFPIFHEDPAGELEQFGCGVLIRIGDDLFALSAAHVLDRAEHADLFMPGAAQMFAMHGAISHCIVPENGRANDLVDIAYYHLAPECGEQLHPETIPATINDLQLNDDVQTGNIHSFVGYPWRKSKRRGRVHSSDKTTYTGHLQPPDVYRRFGYSRVAHIVIRMRRNKTHSSRYGPNSPAAHPQGISGGAVLCWPRSFRDRVLSPSLKIAGIAHSYHERHHSMAATRVISCVMAIVRNNPHLATEFHNRENMVDELSCFLDETILLQRQQNVLSLVGIAWYSAENYSKCLRMFDDASEMPKAFSEWEASAKLTEASIQSEGLTVARVEIDPATLAKWCREHGYRRIDKNARMAFGNIKAAEILRYGK